MGRTIPSTTMGLQMEIESWKTFRKYVPRDDRKLFDEMMEDSHYSWDAMRMAVRTSWFEELAMSIIFSHQRDLNQLEAELAALKKARAAKGSPPTNATETPPKSDASPAIAKETGSDSSGTALPSEAHQ